MTPLLFSVALAFVLSLTSLLAVVFSVSPITTSVQALTAFYSAVLLTVSSLTTLLLTFLYRSLHTLGWNEGKILSTALRQGTWVGLSVMLGVLFFGLEILTWWVFLLIVAMFLLMELALFSR